MILLLLLVLLLDRSRWFLHFSTMASAEAAATETSAYSVIKSFIVANIAAVPFTYAWSPETMAQRLTCPCHHRNLHIWRTQQKQKLDDPYHSKPPPYRHYRKYALLSSPDELAICFFLYYSILVGIFLTPSLYPYIYTHRTCTHSRAADLTFLCQVACTTHATQHVRAELPLAKASRTILLNLFICT